MSQAFSHRVLPYDRADDLLDGALPFLREGIEGGDRVLAVTTLAMHMLLRDKLGADAAGVEFFDSDRWYAHPARHLADTLALAETAAWQKRRLRVLGEPAWARRGPAERSEWQRIEAITNAAFADTGAALLCAYSRTLPAGVVAASRQTHPETTRGRATLPNPGYQDPWLYNARLDSGPLPPAPDDAFDLPIDVPDLYWIRVYVTDFARRTPLPEDDLQRLLVAVTEVVTNALRHGRPPIALRLWLEPGELVCEVTDRGHWTERTGFGLIPPKPAGGAGRFGLWAVRLLCSLVQIRTGRDGTTVRLRLQVPGVPAVPPINLPVNSV
ncbi:sensor histidine kinase [Actinomadura logoneensis]|uniref:Sensor histidine kinase n=1 Tax=Actinomadura logoneensis TaxID=2293572 RepID=A0A372J969_9ACTN|nr:sensor histidine kinase [Actinomadura logoneensis]RFU36552.1 sensor histidine kinase [Actinomadura logoneensis]